jgi:peptide/nickel transport system permease protein
MKTLKIFVSSARMAVGSVLTLLVVLLALFGRSLAPHNPNSVVAPPFTGGGSGHLLGTDYLGQDVLSRVLSGGRDVLITAVLATLFGMVVGVLIGVLAAYAGGWTDEILMRLNDVALAFPQIVLALLLLAALGPSTWLIILLVGFSHVPRVARLARGVALTIVQRDFVSSAEALGESRVRVVGTELLPNMTGPLLAEAGLRLTFSIGLVAAIGFLGFTPNPSKADWGQMINENRLALLVQPWGILAPVIIIAVFTIGTNLIADGIARNFANADS